MTNTLNTDMLRQVAAFIELEPDAFEMETWLAHDERTLCGTVGCIAGSTVLQDPMWAQEWLAQPHLQRAYGEGNLVARACEMLGIDISHNAWEPPPLFTSSKWWIKASKHLGLPTGHKDALTWITAKHAATILHALADGQITLDQFND